MTDLRGKTALITGANSGIGLEASVKIARMGAEVVLVARDRERGEAAVADVKSRSGSNSVSLLLCDFSSQAAIRTLAAEFRAKHGQLHLLVNNAGSASGKRRTTVDGLEQTFAVNHLGYFLLTNLLADLLIKSAPARVVIVASRGHRGATMDFDDLQFANGDYSTFKAYGRSKLGNVLFSNELARRMSGRGVLVNCLHPGVVATNIWGRRSRPMLMQLLVAFLKRFVMISPEQGAEAIVFLATSPLVEGKTGGYYEKNRLVEPSRLARDAVLAQRLWDESA
ncbi:MAG: SDR family oxidoreductase, partial [Candidatus Obscuribacterales bacterium]|nr:SDR family oxidoreductase [Steroidobacteraceae bacterium]